MEVKAEVAGTLQTTTIQHVGKKGEKNKKTICGNLHLLYTMWGPNGSFSKFMCIRCIV